MSLTYPYATLRSYQNTFMDKSELETHPTLKNHVIKEYELKRGPLRPIRVLATS